MGSRIICPLVVITKIFQGTVLVARTYAEGNRVIGKEGEIAIDTPEGRMTFRLQLITRPDGGEDWRLVPPESIAKPPEGVAQVLTIYGRS